MFVERLFGKRAAALLRQQLHGSRVLAWCARPWNPIPFSQCVREICNLFCARPERSVDGKDP